MSRPQPKWLGFSIIGRGSSGVRLFNVAKGEHIVSVARIEETEDEVSDGEDVSEGSETGTAEDGKA